MDMEQEQYLKEMLAKITTVVDRGETVVREIPGLVKKIQGEKYDSAWLQGAEMDSKVQKRRYTSQQAARMAGVSVEALTEAQNDGLLPQPEYRADTAKRVRAGYTVNQINQIRAFFGTLPQKPEGSLAAVLGVLNLKGGSQKTTTCHLFSQYLAMQGYRILVVDTDPQGSLSFVFGKKPDQEVHYEHVIAPYLLEDDQALVAAGHAPGACESLEYAVQPTYWDNIDIIPSCLQNLNIDLLMPRIMERSGVSLVDSIMKLRHGLLGLANNYDFIIIDGTPSLNISTLNVLSACDICFVPTPAAMLDFASTLQFAGLIQETIETYCEGGIYPNVPDIRFFITKYTGSSYAQFMGQMIRRVFNVEQGDVLETEAHASDEIGKANNSTYSIYEQNPSESDNRRRLKSTQEMFNTLFAEMHDAVWETVFGDFPRQPYFEKVAAIQANAQSAKGTFQANSEANTQDAVMEKEEG